MSKQNTKPAMSSSRWTGNMPDAPRPARTTDHPTIYQIRLKGQLEREWTDWFDGLTITLTEEGHTLLTGTVVDQAALYGLLKKVRDLGLPLLAVNAIEASPSDSVKSQP